MKTKRTMWLAVMVMMAMGFNASASLSFDMDMIFEGPGIPTNPGPWLTAEFVDVAADTVRLTISPEGLTAHEKVAGLYFNLNPLLDVTALSFTKQGGVGTFAEPGINLGTDAYKADGDGYYDIRMDFATDTDGAFNGGDAVIYTITLAGLTADSFDFLSAPGGGHGPYKVAAHLLALGEAENSAWVTAPEPTTLVILAIGSMLLGKRK